MSAKAPTSPSIAHSVPSAARPGTPQATPGAAATLLEVLRLLRPYWGWLGLSAGAGVLAGAGTVGLLAQINAMLHSPAGPTGQVAVLLAVLCALVLVGRAASLISSNWVGQRLVAQVRQSLARRILAAPIDALERYRTHRLLPVLTQDVDAVSGTVFALSALAIAMVVAAGCLLYLAWLSLPMFGLLVIALAIGTLIQQLAQRRSAVWFQRARRAEERLHKAYRSLGEGAKELRMHRPRRQHLLEQEITATIEDIGRVNRRATNTFVLASAFGAALYFVLIAVLLASTDPSVGVGVLGSFVLVLLYLKGPMDQIASILPALGRARIAMERIADLTTRFDSPEALADTAAAGRTPLAFTQAIELRDVRYTYLPADVDDDEDTDPPQEGYDDRELADADPLQSFEVGPLDLRIEHGSIVFIVGDNGSGKTTLVKLLLGLYAPQSGQVVLDGVPVEAETRDDYRQLFGTVFSDFYLFEQLHAADAAGPGAAGRDLQAYMERLEIAHKVSVRGGAFSTLDLSTGQRKRLALAHAYLEGRSVLVFDEWAADQDPAFRRLFYRELLPELRALGHTLVVISHDERYFDVADQVVRVSRGRIASVERPAPQEASTVPAPLRIPQRPELEHEFPLELAA